jgi:hypothetical protein
VWVARWRAPAAELRVHPRARALDNTRMHTPWQHTHAHSCAHKHAPCHIDSIVDVPVSLPEKLHSLLLRRARRPTMQQTGKGEGRAAARNEGTNERNEPGRALNCQSTRHSTGQADKQGRQASAPVSNRSARAHTRRPLPPANTHTRAHTPGTRHTTCPHLVGGEGACGGGSRHHHGVSCQHMRSGSRCMSTWPLADSRLRA